MNKPGNEYVSVIVPRARACGLPCQFARDMPMQQFSHHCSRRAAVQRIAVARRQAFPRWIGMMRGEIKQVMHRSIVKTVIERFLDKIR